MSLAIDSITIGSIEDRRLVLGNAQAAAVLNIGNNWTRLRIGTRLAIDDTGANITGTPRLYIGVLSNPTSGLTNGPLTTTTSNFVGIVSSASTWTRSTSTNPCYVNSFIHAVKVGSTLTTLNSTSSNIVFTSANIRNAFVVDITKGSPNFTIQFVCATSTSAADISLSRLKIAMEISSLSGVDSELEIDGGATKYTTSTATNLAVNESTDGSLNAICIAWDRGSGGVPKLYVSDLLFTTFPS